MKKAMLIIILYAMLTACGTTNNTEKEEPTAVTSAVSQTTTTAAETVSNTITSSETTTTTTVTTAEIESSSKTTTKTKNTTSATISKITTNNAEPKKTVKQQTETYVVYYDEPASEIRQTEVKVSDTKPTTTTVQTTPPTVKTTSYATTTTTAAQSGIEWSDSMRVWRKLCEGQMLNGSEQDIIRNEILDYAMGSFNGQKDIHVSFGIDSYDISYENPLHLTVDYNMTSMENAHMDAYSDPNSKWLIDYASSEDEIYAIVSETRESCLHVIDHGLFNRLEIFTINNSLEYASEIEFNVGFDEDMTIWFLTQD